MGKSARVLGWEFDLTAREMNELLKKHGYLYGKPGAYGLTEKGQQYAEEQYHSRGTGGSAQYNPSWETRTWRDETEVALKADMEANPEGFDTKNLSTTEEDAVEYEPFAGSASSGDGNDPQSSWKELAIGGVVLGVLLVAPHVKPFWNSRVKPATKKLRGRLAKQESIKSADS